MRVNPISDTPVFVNKFVFGETHCTMHIGVPWIHSHQLRGNQAYTTFRPLLQVAD